MTVRASTVIMGRRGGYQGRIGDGELIVDDAEQRNAEIGWFVSVDFRVRWFASWLKRALTKA